jgi:putative nucleotidyltransferase with HDIG domain
LIVGPLTAWVTLHTITVPVTSVPPDATKPPGSAARRRPQVPVVWIASAATAVVLTLLSLAESIWFPAQVPAKGSIAAHTIRAPRDAVFDLHETVVAEAREAKQAYVPIYNKDNDLLFDYRERIVKAALAEPLALWRWSPPAGSTADGGPEAGLFVVPPDASPADSRAAETGSAAEGEEGDAGASAAAERVERERRGELEALIRGCVRLLEPFYQAGVVGDSEYPKEKQTVRIFSRDRYVFRDVAELHRFSVLRPALERSAGQFFFKTNPLLRAQVVDYILQRLPPNLTYAKENEKFIADISQVTGVKVVLIRRGEVLVKKGDVVDTRAYYAIRASMLGARDSSRSGALVARFGLLLGLLLLAVAGGRELCPAAFRGLKPHLMIHLGLVMLAGVGAGMLVYLPIHPVFIPQAALVLVAAVVLGRSAGLITAAVAPGALVLTQVFDLSTLVVAVAGGMAAALIARRRRRSSALAAGVLVGVVQAVVFEACRALEGRPQTYSELWSAGQAFGGGLLAGAAALVSLPFVEWLLGRSSRGKLKVLTDFDHPLVRQLLERAPGTFAHTVNLINMVEMATEAVGADRLLARAGALFHDVGKMTQPHLFIENQGNGPNPHDELAPQRSAEAILAHVAEGLRIAKRHRLPPDVAAFIAEHHGTTTVEFFLEKAREEGEVDPALFRYPGPKPQSIESAILMVADAVEAASKTLKEPTESTLHALVDEIVLKKFTEHQFDECGITQGDLERIKAAMVAYLVGALHRRVEYPSQRTGAEP